MVQQGFAIAVVPSSDTPGVLHVWVTSTAHEDGKCFASREVIDFQVRRRDHTPAPGDFNLWLDGMIDFVADAAQRHLSIENPVSVSATYLAAHRGSETLSDKM